MPTAFSKAHPLLACGPKAITQADKKNTGANIPAVVVMLHSWQAYGYGLSLQTFQTFDLPFDDHDESHCLCRSSISPLLHQWLHWTVTFFTATGQAQIFVNGRLSVTCTCPQIRRTARRFCYTGVDLRMERWAQGRIHSLQVYDYALWSHQVSQVYEQLPPPPHWPFTTDPQFPRFLPEETPHPLRIYHPFRDESAVTLTLTASHAGVLPSNPLTLRWTSQQAHTQTVQVKLPAGASEVTISFETTDNPRILAPPPLTIDLFTQARLLSEAILTVEVKRKPEHAGWKANPLRAGTGTAVLKRLPDIGAQAVHRSQLLERRQSAKRRGCQASRPLAGSQR
jgi:hypothetical protein